jgi:hypothetical protein
MLRTHKSFPEAFASYYLRSMKTIKIDNMAKHGEDEDDHTAKEE